MVFGVELQLLLHELVITTPLKLILLLIIFFQLKLFPGIVIMQCIVVLLEALFVVLDRFTTVKLGI